MKNETKHRARQAIMHYIFEFCLTKYWPNMSGDQKYYPGIEGFTPSGYETSGMVQPGDLVILSSCRRWTKWQIGWLREIDEGNKYWRRYLIESLEDGQLCWWENVGLYYFPRDKLSPQWHWTDRQFAFDDRWNRVCYKEKHAYIVRPTPPIFGEGFAVTLGTRTSHGLDDITPSRTFPDWRKVTKAMMGECYDSCVAEHDAIGAARKAQAA